jgi:phage terminase large subunit-like protein
MPGATVATATLPASSRKAPTRRRSTRPPQCGYTVALKDALGNVQNSTCTKRGDHLCMQRAEHVRAFFREVLVHTKSRWARRPFELEKWQWEDIVKPLFGTVVWSNEWEDYVRRYTIAWIEIGRKNGKSELIAGLMLFLLVADGEEEAELYGAAKDRDQAAIIFTVAKRMVDLSPLLSKRLQVNKQQKRLIDERTGSFYQVVAADASGNLGQNPHGIAFDEVISQPNGDLWGALKTGFGARPQPLLLSATTAGNDPDSFAKTEHEDMLRILAEPELSPHTFVYIQNVPADADPWDESNWYLGNPALGQFLSLEVLRQEAKDARMNPRKENLFRQYRLNQWVSQVTRWLSIEEWDANKGEVMPEPRWLDERYKLKRCWAGLDLSSKLDLTAWSLLFEDGTILWRFWCPESTATKLDKATDGKFSTWADDGWVTLTEGDVIDYDSVYAAVQADHDQFAIVDITYDRWTGEPVRQVIEQKTGLEMIESATTYDRMTAPMKELERMLKATELRTGGNPVARWMADAVESKSPTDDPERMRPVKPDRQKSGKRIDGMVTLLMCIAGKMTVEEEEEQPRKPFFLMGSE